MAQKVARLDVAQFTAYGVPGTDDAVTTDGAGNLNVNIAAGNVTVNATRNTSNSITQNATVTVNASSVQAIAANASRKQLILQNGGTTVLYILYGTGTASSSNYTFALQAGGTSNDGSSPPMFDQVWLGAVQWISSGAGGIGIVQEMT